MTLSFLLHHNIGPSPSRIRAGATPEKRRAPFEFYPTPPAAIRALLAAERFEGSIWEPACGNGAIARELIASGYEVAATDLADWGYGAVSRFPERGSPARAKYRDQPALWLWPCRCLRASGPALHRANRRSRGDADEYRLAVPPLAAWQLRPQTAERDLRA